jgi:hypothetical protein
VHPQAEEQKVRVAAFLRQAEPVARPVALVEEPGVLGAAAECFQAAAVASQSLVLP